MFYSPDKIDLDKIVDYKKEYFAVCEGVSGNGNKYTSLCPLHGDRNPSFSFNTETGLFKCFSCGRAGNYVDFYAETHNMSTKDAFKAICDEYGVQTGNQPTAEARRTYTVDDYAAEKRIPADFLKSRFRLDTGYDKRDNQPWIKIPYFDKDGNAVLFRKRYNKKFSQTRFKWGAGSAGKLICYGEWELERAKSTGFCILCEGESDTQALWYMGFPALGIPGASTYQPEWTSRLDGIGTLYLHIEPDRGGQTFLEQMTEKLLKGGFSGTVKRFSCSDVEGAKDPSDLLIANGIEKTPPLIASLMENAQTVDLSKLEEQLPAQIPDMPVRLHTPDGWILSDHGISMIDDKTGNVVCVCRSPVILTRRLHSVDTDEEKIEIAFKRDGRWQTTSTSRSALFQSKSVTFLADLGCTVTSENARLIVRFLEKLEAANYEELKMIDCTGSFGWHGNDRFLPGVAGNLVLDIDRTMERWATAYCQNGTLSDWKAVVSPCRANPFFRFILSASFSAPLLDILRHRIFFVYNWAGARSGKTAALKAALSVWGDPERLMVNFNATQVALERMAGFYCDLPLGIDERQLAGNAQGTLEKIVYMLASGTGRIRGSKSGGLQNQSNWNTVILATGEEPITADTSQTGVSTRIIELYGKPFDNERLASAIHIATADDFGFAGVEFVKQIIANGKSAVQERFAVMLEYVKQIVDELKKKRPSANDKENSSHESAIALVCTADELVSEWIFGEEREAAHREAAELAKTIMEADRDNAQRDVNESAAQFIADWISSNLSAFNATNEYGTKYGVRNREYVYIFPSLFKKALQDAGYSPLKTQKYLAEKGILKYNTNDSGVTRYTVRVKFNDARQCFVCIDTKKLNMSGDADTSAYEDITPRPPEPDDAHYVPVPDDADLPL